MMDVDSPEFVPAGMSLFSKPAAHGGSDLIQSTLLQMFDDPIPADAELTATIHDCRQNKRSWVPMEAILHRCPWMSIEGIREAATKSPHFTVSVDGAHIRRVFGNKDDLVAYLDRIFGDPRYRGSSLHGLALSQGGQVAFDVLVTFPKMKSHNILPEQLFAASKESKVVQPCDSGRACRRIPTMTKDEVKSYIEYLFSDAHYPQDKHLLSLAARSKGSWVAATDIAQFRRLQNNHITAEDVVAAVLDSAVVDISHNQQAMRKNYRNDGRVRPRLKLTFEPKPGVGSGSGSGADSRSEAAGMKALAAKVSPPPINTELGGPPGGASPSGPATPSAVTPATRVHSKLVKELASTWGERPWIPSADASAPGVGSFTVMSWNILADYMAKKDRVTLNVTGAWRERMNVIIARIVSLRPDIVCLQEVQTNDTSGGHMHNPRNNHAEAVLAALKPYGYAGTYNQKAKASCTAVVLWHQETWNHEPSNVWQGFDRATTADPSPASPVAAAEKFSKLRATFVGLQHRVSGRWVIVAGVHTSVPLGRDRQYAHYLPLMDALGCVQCLQHLAPPGSHVSIVWGVDFNSKITDPGPQYLLRGTLPQESLDEVVAQAAAHDFVLPPVPAHALRLSSAYHSVLGRGPRYTNINHKTNFAESIDYVFYSPGPIRPVGVLDVYPWSRALMPTLPVLPNKTIPSDHVPLFTRFCFNPPH